MTHKLTNADIAGSRRWCIAGGWAACPQLATDQDVWIFVDTDTSEPEPELLVEERERMLALFPEITPEEIPVESGVMLDSVRQTYGDLGFAVIKVGTLDNRHVMLTTAHGVKALLASFDISTHQCAITSDGRFVKGDSWTPVTVPPRKLRQTEATNERYIKIALRYSSLIARTQPVVA